MPKEAAVPTELAVPSLIFADEYAEVSGEGAALRAAFAASAPRALSDGEAVVAYLTRASTTPEGATAFVPEEGGTLIAALRLSAPDVFLRSVLPASTAGVIRARNEVAPFFIFRVDSYERSFGGMLEWEPRMAGDLADLYPALPPTAPPPPLSTTTPASSTTPPVMPATALSFSSGFADSIVESRDARVFRDAEGRTLMLYGFYDKETLILARSEEAFAELVRRLAASRAR
jgi:hypothetical protein